MGAIRIAPSCQNSPILSKNILVGTTTFNFYSIDHVIIRMRTCRRAAAIVLETEPSQSNIQALCKATRKRAEDERRKLNRTLRSEEIKMMTREKEKVAKKARLAPDLREKKLQVRKGPSKAIFERSEEACEQCFRIHFK